MRFDDEESVESALDDARIESDLLRVFHGRMVVWHQHAVVLHLQAEMAVAQFEAQTPHLLHGMHRDLDELRGADTGEIAFVGGFGEHIAVCDGGADRDAELGAVGGDFAHALLIGLEPFEFDRNVQLAVGECVRNDVAGDAVGDHEPAAAFRLHCL